MKKLVYLMSLVALLFCYSCNTSGSGGKKEQFLSFCKERMKIYEEGIDKMLAAEYPDEFHRICQVYNRRLEDSTKKASTSLSEEECIKLYEEIARVLKAKNKPFGVATGPDEEFIELWLKLGATIIFAGHDMGFVQKGASANKTLLEGIVSRNS